MRGWETLSHTERALLLAFLPVLGASAYLATALGAVLIMVVAALAIRGLARLLPATCSPATAWPLFVTLGFTIAQVVAGAVAWILPLAPDQMLWLHLTGLTPAVFIGVSEHGAAGAPVATLGRCCTLVLLFAVIREPIGSGTLLGLGSGAWIPFGILSSSAGALLLAATLTLVLAVTRHRCRPAELCS